MTKKDKQSYLHVAFVATAVVLFWRGMWGLMDLYIFPNNPLASYTLSLVAGVAVLVITDKLVDTLI